MTLAMLNVLPEPVIPRSTWQRSPLSMPRHISAIARGWSPRGMNSETSWNGPDIGTTLYSSSVCPAQAVQRERNRQDAKAAKNLGWLREEAHFGETQRVGPAARNVERLEGFGRCAASKVVDRAHRQNEPGARAEPRTKSVSGRRPSSRTVTRPPR